jgi:hypothetical protein
MVSIAAGAKSLDNHRNLFAAWNRWLDRGAPFAVLRIFVDTLALVHPESGARLAKRWLGDNAERMRHSVLGIASIVPASAYEKMSRMDIEKAYGVPGGVFLDRNDALLWLATQVFAPRGMKFDRAGAKAALSGVAAEKV